MNKFSVWEERCQLILQNIALYHKCLYCLFYVRWHSLRAADIYNIVWLDQFGNISVKPGSWSAFTIDMFSQVPLGQVTCISTPLSSLQRSTWGLGNLSHDPNFFTYLPSPTHIKSPNKSWTSLNNRVFLNTSSLSCKATGASLAAQLVKNLPAVQETRVWPLGREDPLEKRMATHSSTLAFRTEWTVQSMGSQRIGHDCATNFPFLSKATWRGETHLL